MIMKEFSELEALERALPILEGQYRLYQEAKDKSHYARLKRDREHASSDMMIHADFLEKELTNNRYVLATIYDGNQFQFEDFYRYVDSDMPEFLQKIKDRIEVLKGEE